MISRVLRFTELQEDALFVAPSNWKGDYGDGSFTVGTERYLFAEFVVEDRYIAKVYSIPADMEVVNAYASLFTNAYAYQKNTLARW